MSGRAPRVPRLLLRALDAIERDAVIGDLEEEYLEHARPHQGPVRARVWFWKHLVQTLVVGLVKMIGNPRKHVTPRERQPTHPNRGTPQSQPMSTFWKDFRYGIRMLYKTPGLSLVAIITIALGIGLVTHTFSIVYGSIIRGLPFEGGDRLTTLWETAPADGVNQRSVTIHNFADWRDQQTAFDDLAAYFSGTINLADTDSRPERYQGTFTTAAIFSQVNTTPLLGRVFRDEEDTGRTPPTIILGYNVWQTRYGGDPNIIGRTVRANGLATTVIGVMPDGFRFPFDNDLWVPLAIDPLEEQRDQASRVAVIGRLNEGVTVEEAQTQMDGITQRLAAEYPETNEGLGAFVQLYVDNVMPTQITAILWLMLAAVFGVLFIACANVANLLLARSSIRAKEVAIRSALGASRSRLIRQLLIEAVILALGGGVIGIVLASVGIDIFNAAIVDIQKPYWIDIRLDTPVLLFSMAATMLASVVSGTVPAFKASGTDVHEILKDESRGSSSFRMGRFSTGLVVAEIALSCALLVGAGMMVKSVMRLKTLDFGFVSANVFTARVGLFETDYPDADSRLQFFEGLQQRLGAIPGVQSAALTNSLPGTGAGQWSFAVEGVSYDTDRDYPFANRTTITPGYFDTFEVGLLEGRDFTTQDRDGSLSVTTVNESFARKYFPQQSAVGKRIRLGRSNSENPWMTVVGVVPDLHVGGGVGGLGSSNQNPEHFYTPLAQGAQRFMSITLKTRGDPLAVAPLVRETVAAIDPNLPIYWVYSMDKAIEQATWAFGLFGSLFSMFGAIALFMAAVGLYGVMAFSVSRRTQEMGIRMALGAYGNDIVRLVLKKGMLQLGVGMTIGLGLGVAMAMPLRVALFDVNPTDPTVYAAIVLTLTAAGLLACLVPARRATRVNLVDALRPE